MIVQDFTNTVKRILGLLLQLLYCFDRGRAISWKERLHGTSMIGPLSGRLHRKGGI